MSKIFGSRAFLDDQEALIRPFKVAVRSGAEASVIAREAQQLLDNIEYYSPKERAYLYRAILPLLDGNQNQILKTILEKMNTSETVSAEAASIRKSYGSDIERMEQLIELHAKHPDDIDVITDIGKLAMFADRPDIAKHYLELAVNDGRINGDNLMYNRARLNCAYAVLGLK